MKWNWVDCVESLQPGTDRMISTKQHNHKVRTTFTFWQQMLLQWEEWIGEYHYQSHSETQKCHYSCKYIMDNFWNYNAIFNQSLKAIVMSIMENDNCVAMLNQALNDSTLLN